jgi:hypothetical protein
MDGPSAPSWPKPAREPQASGHSGDAAQHHAPAWQAGATGGGADFGRSAAAAGGMRQRSGGGPPGPGAVSDLSGRHAAAVRPIGSSPRGAIDREHVRFTASQDGPKDRPMMEIFLPRCSDSPEHAGRSELVALQVEDFVAPLPASPPLPHPARCGRRVGSRKTRFGKKEQNKYRPAPYCLRPLYGCMLPRAAWSREWKHIRNNDESRHEGGLRTDCVT